MSGVKEKTWTIKTLEGIDKPFYSISGYDLSTIQHAQIIPGYDL